MKDDPCDSYDEDSSSCDDAFDIFNKSTELIEESVKNGFNINTIKKHVRVHYSHSFIYYCCRKRDIERMKLALNLGANPNLIEIFGIYERGKLIRTSKSPIIHVAIAGFFIEGIKLLLEYNCDLFIKNSYGRNAISFARMIYRQINIIDNRLCTCNEINEEFICKTCDSKTIYDLIRNHHQRNVTLFKMLYKKHKKLRTSLITYMMPPQ